MVEREWVRVGRKKGEGGEGAEPNRLAKGDVCWNGVGRVGDVGRGEDG